MPQEEVQYCAKVMQTYFAEIRGLSTKKYQIFDESKFATKSHDN